MSTESNRRNLKVGDAGPDVAELQANLGVEADGEFNRRTEHAVREFQHHNRLTVDGIAGKEVYGVMFPTET